MVQLEESMCSETENLLAHDDKVKFICIAHFMYKTIQSALHKIKTLQQGAEKALKNM